MKVTEDKPKRAKMFRNAGILGGVGIISVIIGGIGIGNLLLFFCFLDSDKLLPFLTRNKTFSK
jgi:hypothetical protein